MWLKPLFVYFQIFIDAKYFFSSRDISTFFEAVKMKDWGKTFADEISPKVRNSFPAFGEIFSLSAAAAAAAGLIDSWGWQVSLECCQ